MFVAKIKTLSFLLLSTVVNAEITCNSGYECWEDSNSNLVWVVGGGTSENCQTVCANSLNNQGDEYRCKPDQPIIANTEDFNQSPISDGLDFECVNGWCWGSSTGNGMMYIQSGTNSQRQCYYPSSDVFSCDTNIGNANCFGTRFNQLCPCVKDEPACPTPTAHVPCNEGFTCWKDESSEIVWTIGGDYTKSCKFTCQNAHSASTDFYSCKSDEPPRRNENELQPISDGMGFNCESNVCDWGGSPNLGQMMVSANGDDCDRTCLLPNSDDYLKCNEPIGQANCLGERYTLVCPCHTVPLDESCEWSCPDHSAPVAKWPENMETGTSCLERINYWRKRACNEGWHECPPGGLPPIVECTSCHKCANTQSEYDVIFGSHSSFTRCGESDQGSGGGPNCAALIDGFIAERDLLFNGKCLGHCAPILYPGCTEFHWGRTKETNEAGHYHYTLNWGSCDTDTCNSYCDSVEGTDDDCFSSGVETLSCHDGPTDPPSVVPTDDPSIAASTKAPTVAPTDEPSIDPSKAPTKAPTDEPSNDPTMAPTKAPTEEPSNDPSKAPTKAPTNEPSNDPTMAPAKAPVSDDVICEDGDRFFMKEKQGVVKTMKCETLARKSTNKINTICANRVHYGQDGDVVYGPPRAVCPETCDSCGPCHEHANTRFYLKTSNRGVHRYKSCSWLSQQSDSTIDSVCSTDAAEGQVYPSAREACPISCGICNASE